MNQESGFTILEVIVAILLLTLGIISLVRANAGMAAMLSRGDRATTAMSYAQDRLERLRATDCADLADGSEVVATHYQLVWTVSAPISGATRRVVLITGYPNGRTQRLDTLQTSVLC